uniref:TTC5_OB domain-containing protein n=1 Tax=Caenorhabditis tropicalis TaxID=1561998 RepID=A0A1I7UJ09_9PELO
MEKNKRDLELYKRFYFKNNPSSTKSQESEAVLKRAEECIKNNLPSIVCSTRAYDTNQKALLLSEAGKLYNVLEEYNETAEKFLSQAARMNPKNIDTWHELGLCVMKRADLEYAQSCFKIALGIQRTAPILTSLAVSMRLVALDHPEPAQTEMRTKAMELIIEARRLDSSYGPANIAFATGLFYCFFTTAKVELKFLDKVVENYRKALQCELSRTDPEVHMNMATCLKFMEKHEEALESLEAAVECDARNELHTKETLDDYGKRLMEMINELKKTTGDGFKIKIIGNVGHQESIPLALVGVDATGEIYGITIYNCHSNFGFVIGDCLTIAKPDFREIKNFRIPSETPVVVECLKWIRVATPTQIKKNGVALPESVLARAVTSTQTK